MGKIWAVLLTLVTCFVLIMVLVTINYYWKGFASSFMGGVVAWNIKRMYKFFIGVK